MITALTIGQMWEGGTCLARASALEKFGWKVKKFDVSPYYTCGSRLRRGMQHRLLLGPDVSRMNRDIIRLLRENPRVDVVWVDKGVWIWPETLKEVKSITNAILVHYTPDPAFVVHTSRHFRKSVPLYDLMITTKKYELEEYRKAGARKVIFTWQGVDDRFERCKKCKVDNPEREGLVFIGHCESYYVEMLTAVAEAGLPLKIWGPGWPQVAKRNKALARCVQGGPVLGKAYPEALATGAIGIGLLSKMYPDAFTTRSFEIPAAGCMLLAERTEDHMELFKEGKEAVFFSGKKELVNKSFEFLEKEELRIYMAENARKRTLHSYTWYKTLKEAIELCIDLLEKGK